VAALLSSGRKCNRFFEIVVIIIIIETFRIFWMFYRSEMGQVDAGGLKCV
jgi:hypothetical protein